MKAYSPCLAIFESICIIKFGKYKGDMEPFHFNS